MRSTRVRWATSSLSLALLACSGDAEPTSPGATTAPAQVVIVSGSDQAGKAGQMIAEPFVVRVMDHRGRGVGNVEVTWTVTFGEGVLQGEWEACPDGEGFGDPVRSVSRSTDDDGIVRLSFMPTSFGLVTVIAEVPGLQGSPIIFTTDATDPGAAITIVSGNNQEVFAGFVARPQREPFIVRVTDGDGNAVPHVRVGWDVVFGRGALLPTRGCADPGDHRAVTRTGTDGEAALEFEPRSPGIGTVTAAALGIAPPLAFTIEVHALAIGLRLLHDPWLAADYTAFVGFDYNSDLAWPIGAAVEFWNLVPAAHVTSTSAPPGAAFDSGALTEGERFQFVPDAAGTWNFVDLVSGATGALSTVVVVELGYDAWVDETGFWTRGTVLPGMAVEFRIGVPTARIASTSTPAGGDSFDSGSLNSGELFHFVPDVAGTWEFVDAVSGAKGAFTVQP
jgi:hypothetical protein